MTELAPLLWNALAVFALAFLVRLLVRGRKRLSYASSLVFVGLLVSILGVSFDIELTSELIFTILLPTILFHGTTTIDVRMLRRNVPLIAVLTLVGLPAAVALLGAIGTMAFGFPLLVALIFAALVLPTDPAAVLSLFGEFSVSKRLSVTIEAESLFNDGVAIVLFSTLLGVLESESVSVAHLATVSGAVRFAADVAFVGGGGLVFGSVVGYVAHLLARRLDDERTVLLLTVLVAYGSFLWADYYLGISGVLAVVGAGLGMGAHEKTHVKMSASESAVQDVWHTAAFLVSTVLYVLIGAEVAISNFLRYADLVLLAAVLVLLVRAITIYPLVITMNNVLDEPVPVYCQHIMVWAGLHTVVPVALVLSLPPTFPFRSELRTMVFGVAIISIVVQGLLMPVVLDLTGLTDPDTIRS